ncbi:conjugal transfer protein TraG N-terminal domain-containing protein [uncultured Vibrio sp.]|uniref:conjugal transfer protein TraG N-terminal domain-containing protein n=1 Tax=uncultured Vibrio sp. TaxID=114054 RepID=UPI002602EB98|nr:conjugal transfer protein TraG N-terminal domain-containing protein [uncultured Vibrio sp.]
MVVNDPLSVLLTLTSWQISGKIFMILNQSGLIVFMLAVIVFQVWFDVAQEGEDEGNKGLLSMNRTEVKLTLASLVCFFAVVPLVPVNVNTLVFDQNASESCGVGLSSGATSNNQSSLNGEEVNVPIWWALWHSLSQGLTNAAVSSVPCHYDIELSMLKISQIDIKNEPLRQETQDFYEQCYTRARMMMKAAARKELVSQSDFNNANWIGGAYFLGYNLLAPKTTYNGLQAEKIVFNFPYNSERDDPVQQKYRRSAIDTSAAYPMCDEWWDSTQEGRSDGQRAGLLWRLFNHIEDTNPELVHDIFDYDGFFSKIMGSEVTPADKANMLVQRALSVENQSTSGRIVRGYAQVLDKTLDHQAREVWNGTAGWAGLQIGHIFTGPAYFIIRQAMPMLQSLLLVVVVVASPIVLTVSNYSMMTLMSLSLSYTGLLFLTFWWELCRSLDSKLLEGVYSMHDNFNLITGTLNAMDDAILKFVMVVFYVVVPAIWFGVLGYASYRVNGVSMDSAVEKVNKTTQLGFETIKNKVSR